MSGAETRHPQMTKAVEPNIGDKLRAQIEAGSYRTAVELAHATLARRSRLDVRLALGKALAMQGKNADATAVLEQTYRDARRAASSEIAADALEWLSWLAWTDLDGERTRRIAEQMLTLAVPATSPEAFRLFVRKACQSLQLGDAAAAGRILEEAEHVSSAADIDSFASYLSMKADVLAALARPADALSYARLAADIAAKRNDPYLRWRRLLYLGYILHSNGMLAEAYEAYMAGAAVAAEASLTWEVPLTRARAAWDALLLGRVADAHRLISSCFEPPYEQRWMACTRSWVGITVGLAAGDDALVARAADDELLDGVLSSDDYYCIGPTVAAYHAYYLHIGKRQRASELLEFGIANLPSPDCGWALFRAVAQHGSDAALRRAQQLIETFPREHRVAEAHRQLFAALLAARRGKRTESERHAGEAQLLFDDFSCEFYAATCLELAGRLSEALRRYNAMGATGEASRIAGSHGRRGRPRRGFEASRERREILRLLLEGLTSSSVADRLGVSERTIKSRISEIYDFEGVSSRIELFALYKLPRRMIVSPGVVYEAGGRLG